ncbi:hypothetical protein DOTSEDRAFT_89510 [Dothistroma septosporum NZE10]|uniref:Helicase C-terminal domain-containing protein n=1 Tax=Dothistroma septosporum (strain NZE10 / CBS 128990) TaxID=675120 RepID=N1PKZ3_DOTSN|nr:hypothetical protein DOTSEDRAFT_89510 [Dothistroma septosporum NZE10]
MPSLMSWLHLGGLTKDTTTTMEQRSRANGIMDISYEDDSDDSIVLTQSLQPSTKRKVIDISNDDAETMPSERPRKVAKTSKTSAKATIARAHRKVIDISKSDDEDAANKRRKRPAGVTALSDSKRIERPVRRPRLGGMQRWLEKSGPTHGRGAFRELDARQFQNRLRGPVAWFRRPVYSEAFQSQFAPKRATRTLSTVPSGIDEVDILERTSQGTRPQRAKARQSYKPAASMEESEDELAMRPRQNRAKQQAKSIAISDVSDFEMHDDSEASALRSDSSVENANDFPERAAKKPKLETSGKKTTTKKTSSSGDRGLNEGLPPCSNIRDIFADITKRALSLGVADALTSLNSRPLRAATMCSGSESPLLALQMLEDSLRSLWPTHKIRVEHLFSAEIVPFKQAYIERNFKPPLIFRDITEITEAFNSESPVATTAYGGKVPIPQDLDLLIAGTSCVDFSRQNSRKKGLDDGGESGNTWNAVLAFCKAARPGIVLLENVSGAPWDDMLADYEKIGYECSGVLIDTKDYYLPQTRQRGYMVAFDKRKLAAANADQAVKANQASTKWQMLMEQFRRPASSPVSSFLLPSDLVKLQLSRNDDVVREIDWSICEITQMQYRQETRLGDGRPVTSWTVNGYIQPPDYAHKLWFRGVVERVKDTIDAAVLRKALQSNGMYDLTFKLRIIDLSQNVHRETDTRPFGIIGCITPTGMFYASNRGRPLTAEELLQLQGLPLNKISFTTETPTQIQDLAGNAMSTTTIGCAILSALITGHKIIPDRPLALGTGGMKPPAPATVPMRNLVVASSAPVEMTEIKRRAGQAMRRCYCETSTGLTSKSLQQCKDCGHTTCTSCGGKPVHNYEAKPLMSNGRLHPSTFEEHLRSLPLQMRVNAPSKILSNALANTKDLPARYRVQLYAAMTETFSFSRVRRTHCWTVSYLSSSLSSSARLDLVIEDGDNVEWRLYAHIPPSLAANDTLRHMLRHPVLTISARENFVGKRMLIRVPSTQAVPVQIEGSGKKVASWWNRNGMPDFTDHYMWERLSITIKKPLEGSINDMLKGEYRYLEKCGTAAACLYVKVHPSSGRPLYLFLDPTPTGRPDEDRFVFSHTPGRPEDDDVRPIVAAIAPPWRAYSTKGRCIPSTTKATLLIEQKWHQLNCTLETAKPNITISTAKDITTHLESASCSENLTLVRADLFADVNSSFGSGVVDQRDAEFFRAYAAILEAMRRALPYSSWHALAVKRSPCVGCAPPKATVQWALSQSGTVKPYEIPQDAAAYEHAIKARCRALEMRSRVEGNRLQLDLVINVTTLAHRAAACLPDKELHKATRWRLSTLSHAAEASTAVPTFVLRETVGVKHHISGIPLKVRLFPKQQQVLSWMKRQEDANGISFDLEEAAEDSIPALNLRLDVRATQTIRVRGGFCADHPGFGKTVTSLALIYSELQHTGREGIVSDLESRQIKYAAGLIPTAATLIVCPGPLVRQWVEEIKDKVQQPGTVFIINTAADLARLTIEDIQKASIVVLNRSVCGGETYTGRLASFAAMPGPAAATGRSYAHWLGHATATIPRHLKILRPNGQTTGINTLVRHLKNTYSANIKSDQFQRNVPSRRLRGADYAAAKRRTKTSALKAATVVVDTSHVGEPLLEMFYFNRIVVDESHLLDAKERVVIGSLKADKRWALSATPDLGDCYSVAQIAALLGVPLRLGRVARGDLKKASFNEINKEMTSFEMFDSMRQPPSDAMQARISEKAQDFLDTFVRRNIMDYDDSLRLKEHLVPVHLETAHMAIYNEVSQHLNSLDMRIKKSAVDHDRQRRLNAVIDDCSTAEEALLRTAAHFDGTLDLDGIVEQRQAEVATAMIDLQSKIVVARSAEPGVWALWKQRLDAGNLGDASVTKLIQATIARVKTTLKSPKAPRSDEDPNPGRGGGKRQHTAAVNTLCNRLLAAERSARYLSNVKLITEVAICGTDVAKRCCANPSCDSAATDHDRASSASCGHVICQACYASMKSRAMTKCPSAGCSSTMHDTDLLWASKVTRAQDFESKPFGAKIQAVLEILYKVQEQGEQAIVFVQLESQLDEIEQALQDQDITASVVKSSASAGTQIADFRETANTKQHKTVLVLNASDETAAGSNLQNANHVIFLSPLLRDTQYGYESTMKQAIGRVRRYGQKRPIHVYRLVALHTIDILQPSSIKSLDMREEITPERVQLVCEKGAYSLRPHSWLLCCGDGDTKEVSSVYGKKRISGWEDFSSLVKFGKTYADHEG